MTTFLAQNQFMSSAAHVPVADGSAAATPCPRPPAAAGTFDEEYRCPGGQIVDAAGCELCGPISNADCPYWPAEPSIAMEVPSEAPASAPTKNPDAGALGTDCIGEIFHYARKLPAEARWFVPDYPAIYQAMLDPCAPRALETDPVWADEPPLFLQKREA